LFYSAWYCIEHSNRHSGIEVPSFHIPVAFEMQEVDAIIQVIGLIEGNIIILHADNGQQKE
jgi:hypothetical protein